MKGIFANIIVDISHEKVDRPFQYRGPDALMGQLEVGMSVLIPFGRGNKLIKGYVMELTDTPEYEISKIKYVDSVVKGGVSAQADSIKLAWWIKEHYGSTMISALKTVLPVKQKMKQVVKKTICCLVDPDTAFAKSEEFENKHQNAKARLMRELAGQPMLPQLLVTGKLNVTTQTIRSLEQAGLIKVTEENVYRNALPDTASNHWNTGGRKQLSREQQAIVDAVIGEFRQGITDTYLLRGVTGSGKTEVYMEVIEQMIAEGKQAIVLIR